MCRDPFKEVRRLSVVALSSVGPVVSVSALPRVDPRYPGSMNTDWIVVHTAQGDFEEGQVRRFLEAHDIPTASSGEALRTTHGLTMNGLGAVRILVPPDREAEALDLLQRVAAGDLKLASEHLPGDTANE